MAKVELTWEKELFHFGIVIGKWNFEWLRLGFMCDIIVEKYL